MTSTSFKAIKTNTAFQIVDNQTSRTVAEMDYDGFNFYGNNTVYLTTTPTGVVTTVNGEQFDKVLELQVSVPKVITATGNGFEHLAIPIQVLPQRCLIYGYKVSMALVTSTGTTGNCYYSLGTTLTDGHETNYAAGWDNILTKASLALPGSSSPATNMVLKTAANEITAGSTVYLNIWSVTAGGWTGAATLTFGDSALVGPKVTLLVKMLQ